MSNQTQMTKPNDSHDEALLEACKLGSESAALEVDRLLDKCYNLQQQRDELQQRNDELLAALRDIDAKLTGTLPLTAQVKDIARAAITSVERRVE